jgi:Tfp pilus assembly protein PilF
MIQQFEKMLAQGQDNALLRFSLGNAYLKQDEPLKAVEHLRIAVQHDPDYSAAWRQLGTALNAARQTDAALQAYEQGIQVAAARGDKQAVKEMQVFARRLRKHQANP